MGSAFSLAVPEEEQTLDTGEQFYKYYVENSAYADSVEELFEYKQFKERLESEDLFMVYKKPTTTVVDAGDPSMAEILFEYEDKDQGWVVQDQVGLNKFIESLETARENLKRDGELSEGDDRTIEMCISIIQFAKENGYGVKFS
ncbi:hypothetical protein G3I44_16335 [Halogeometricum borinquense]|uniref:Uncharacterized protein n=1 Tax=Halogeometricum borinquense TaxID=60847 RepID=A0A6C0UJN7_9EURY|nr:hypothetical protein [Halogeometricum borinquense]QIB75712.1 hypothetical protein G3I44_16335 [Halogeometricum borinquense]